MNCETARLLIHGHLDRELDPARDVEVEEHLRGCPRCSTAYEALRAEHLLLQEPSLRYRTPDALARKIRALADDRSQASMWARLRGFFPRPIQFGIPMAIGAAIALFVAPLLQSPASNDVANQIIASHVRSMMASHLMDVASTDQHTVKPWFNGKLDFSPPVTDYAKDGFPLIGGRLDYIAGHPVAALVYQHGKHVINAFMWPKTGDTVGAPVSETDRGYNVDQVQLTGMNCWIVSDLNRRELTQFAELLRANR